MEILPPDLEALVATLNSFVMRPTSTRLSAATGTSVPVLATVPETVPETDESDFRDSIASLNAENGEDGEWGVVETQGAGAGESSDGEDSGSSDSSNDELSGSTNSSYDSSASDSDQDVEGERPQQSSV